MLAPSAQRRIPEPLVLCGCCLRCHIPELCLPSLSRFCVILPPSRCGQTAEWRSHHSNSPDFDAAAFEWRETIVKKKHTPRIWNKYNKMKPTQEKHDFCERAIADTHSFVMVDSTGKQRYIAPCAQVGPGERRMFRRERARAWCRGEH
jgi:hypothetical protein